VVTKTDSSGNVWTYTFDFHNQLTQVVEKNSGGTTILTENMTYDVFGNLIGLAVNGTPERWTVFDGSNPYLDFNGSGTLTQRWLTSPTARYLYFASVSASGAVNWLFTDFLGSIREVVSSGGTVLDQITYGAFGNILSQTNSSNAPRFLYAGGQWDANLGEYLFGARWQDAVDGRWISQDPLGLSPDTNPYRYVHNSPADGTDPTGEFEPCTIIAIVAIGAIIGGIIAGENAMENGSPDPQGQVLAGMAVGAGAAALGLLIGAACGALVLSADGTTVVAVAGGGLAAIQRNITTLHIKLQEVNETIRWLIGTIGAMQQRGISPSPAMLERLRDLNAQKTHLNEVLELLKQQRGY